MELKLPIWYTLILCLSGLSGLQAQESINATGGNDFGIGGSISYSIGQVAYTIASDSTSTVTPGVQQPYEFSMVPDRTVDEEFNPILLTYPNPANDLLVLETNQTLDSKMFLQLFDIDGNPIRQQEISESRTKIDLSSLVPGTYLLYVFNSRQEVKTFKIIKFR